MFTGWGISQGLAEPEEIEAGRVARQQLEDALTDQAARALQLERQTVAGDRQMSQDVAAFLGRGATEQQVLARPDRAVDSSRWAELKRAREILDAEGLGHLLPGHIDAIVDPNMGLVHIKRPRKTFEEQLAASRARRCARRPEEDSDVVARSQAARPETYGQAWTGLWSKFMAGGR